MEAHNLNAPSYIRLEKGILPIIHSSEFDLKDGFREVKKAEDIFTNIETLSNKDLPYSTIAILYLLNQQSLP